MKKSRYYQTLVQVVGSFGDVVLFFSGWLMGKEYLLFALILILLRIGFKITVSELMYRRMKAVIREETKNEKGEEKNVR